VFCVFFRAGLYFCEFWNLFVRSGNNFDHDYRGGRAVFLIWETVSIYRVVGGETQKLYTYQAQCVSFVKLTVVYPNISTEVGTLLHKPLNCLVKYWPNIDSNFRRGLQQPRSSVCAEMWTGDKLLGNLFRYGTCSWKGLICEINMFVTIYCHCAVPEPSLSRNHNDLKWQTQPYTLYLNSKPQNGVGKYFTDCPQATACHNFLFCRCDIKNYAALSQNRSPTDITFLLIELLKYIIQEPSKASFVYLKFCSSASEFMFTDSEDNCKFAVRVTVHYSVEEFVAL